MKYPKLEEPCHSCIYKCGRVEDINFIKDENCKYAQSPIKQIKEKLGMQERIKI